MEMFVARVAAGVLRRLEGSDGARGIFGQGSEFGKSASHRWAPGSYFLQKLECFLHGVFVCEGECRCSMAQRNRTQAERRQQPGRSPLDTSSSPLSSRKRRNTPACNLLVYESDHCRLYLRFQSGLLSLTCQLLCACLLFRAAKAVGKKSLKGQRMRLDRICDWC